MRNIDWPTVVFWALGIVFGLLLFVALPLALIAEGKHDAELRERYIRICVEDHKKTDPYMKGEEALERCEVAWEMAKAQRPKPDTNVVVMPAVR